MNYHDIKKISFSASLLFHSILMVIFLLINLSFEFPAKDYVELSFGISSEFGSSGAVGEKLDIIQELAKPEEENITENKNPEVKEVKLPVAKNTQDENVVKPAEKDKEQKKETKTETSTETTSDVATTGQGNLARGEGSFGFDIEWGGMGTRKIYSYSLPSYPDGVNKEIDIRLRFTIKPDGTVGSISLLTKADTKLENAAINSLWQWRFEPLSPTQQQGEQTAVIVFPYRLQ